MENPLEDLNLFLRISHFNIIIIIIITVVIIIIIIIIIITIITDLFNVNRSEKFYNEKYLHRSSYTTQ